MTFTRRNFLATLPVLAALPFLGNAPPIQREAVGGFAFGYSGGSFLVGGEIGHYESFRFIQSTAMHISATPKRVIKTPSNLLSALMKRM